MKNLMQKFTKMVSDNREGILTAIGIVGFSTAVIWTAKKAPKAKEVWDETKRELENEEDLSKPEIIFEEVKSVMPYYGPTLLMCGVSSCCIIGSYASQKRKAAALAAAYEVTEQFTRTYISKVKEKLGEKGESEVRDATYKDISEQYLPEKGDAANIVTTGHGDQLFFDSGTGLYFRSSVHWLEKVRSECSDEVRNGCTNEISINDLRYRIGLDPCALGNIACLDLNDFDNWLHCLEIFWDKRCYMAPWGETYGVLEYPVHERCRD